MRWLRPQINWNAALWLDTVATLSPALRDLLGYDSGNVEAQVPNGQRSPVHAPANLGMDRDRAFDLGPGAVRGN